MKFIADLHIHSKFSQATSKDLVIQNLEKYARIKGVGMLGTGDFTHPKWIQELKSNLKDDNSGIFRTETGFPFMLQTEISLIYSQGGRGRRVHNIVYAPDFDTVSQITDYLLTKGRVDYDGRPIFNIPCPEFVESLKSINPKIEIVPAHIWTPWFSMLGSKSGFDSVRECFLDQEKHIFALETGLSSDPPMNWRLSQLDRFTLVSNSDLHSFWPWRIGREANIFDTDMTYDAIMKAMRTRQGFVGTIEVDPNYGKYHYDGHRKCNFCSSPKETINLKGICPVCKKPLTIGVEYRVEELADRPQGFVLEGAPKFYSLLPLSEIISIINSRGIATKAVWQEYHNLVSKERNEFEVLLETPHEDLLQLTSRPVADAIIKARKGSLKFRPGYDGEYGMPVFDNDKNIQEKDTTPANQVTPQKGLGDFF